jgi:FAD:protein FMN transferase
MLNALPSFRLLIVLALLALAGNPSAGGRGPGASPGKSGFEILSCSPLIQGPRPWSLLSALGDFAPRAGRRRFPSPEPRNYTQIHMGVPVRIRLYTDDEAVAQAAARAAYARIASLDQMMSDYRPDSELRRLERTAGQWTVVSPELFAVLTRAVEIARASDGAFDPTVGPLVALWRQARSSHRMPARAALDAARARVGWHHIDRDSTRRAIRLRRPGMRLDLGGIAKGYILQEAARTLRAHDVTRTLVEGGGDIVVGDAPPGRDGWQIEADGSDGAFRERAARLTNAALSTSGHTAQFVEIDGVRYSHVIDPRSGLGLTNQIVARVIARDAATSDALSTALTVVGPDGAAKLLAKFPEVTASLERVPVVSKSPSSPWCKSACIRPAMHPAWLRCSSLKLAKRS